MADVDLRSVMNYEALRGIGEISLFREVEDKTYAGPCSFEIPQGGGSKRPFPPGHVIQKAHLPTYRVCQQTFADAIPGLVLPPSGASCADPVCCRSVGESRVQAGLSLLICRVDKFVRCPSHSPN